VTHKGVEVSLMFVGDILACLPDLGILGRLGVHAIFSDDVVFNAKVILNGGELFGCQSSSHCVFLLL